MRRKGFLIGGIIWSVVAVLILTVLVLGFTDNLDLSRLSIGNVVFSVGGSTELIKEESFSLKDINKLAISASSQDIIINLVDGDTMTVRHYDLEGAEPFTSSRSSGSLSVSVKPRNITISGFMAVYDPRLEIDLPESYAEAMNLSTGSGSIRGGDIALQWADTALATNSGSIKFGAGISCSALEISSGSGTVELGNTFAGSLSLKTNSGTQRLGELTVRGSVTLSSGSGSISAEDITGGDLSVDTNSGTIRLNDITADGTLRLESGSGSVTTEEIKVRDMYVITNSGTIRLGDAAAQGTVSVSSGSGSQTAGYVACTGFEISTNSGTISYEGLSGYGSIESGSGSITCRSLDIRGDSIVKSNSGTVRLDLADNQNFEITISTNSGSIRAGDLNLAYTSQRGNDAFGTVGSGKNGKLGITTGSGSINIDD